MFACCFCQRVSSVYFILTPYSPLANGFDPSLLFKAFVRSATRRPSLPEPPSPVGTLFSFPSLCSPWPSVQIHLLGVCLPLTLISNSPSHSKTAETLCCRWSIVSCRPGFQYNSLTALTYHKFRRKPSLVFFIAVTMTAPISPLPRFFPASPASSPLPLLPLPPVSLWSFT